MTIRLSVYSLRTRREYHIGFPGTRADYAIMVTNLYAAANNPQVEIRAFACEQSFFTYVAALEDLHVRDVVQTVIPKGE